MRYNEMRGEALRLSHRRTEPEGSPDHEDDEQRLIDDANALEREIDLEDELREEYYYNL